MSTEETNRPAIEHAVENGELKRLSVSQVKSFKMCERKWYYEKVLRLPSPSRKSQELGKKVHGELEHFAKTGEDVLGRIARSGIEFYPTPGPDLLVEASFGALQSAGVPFVGFIDLLDPRNPDEPHVIDYKTTSNISRWAMNEKALTEDIQQVGYSESVRLRYPNAKRVRCTWIYLQTDGMPRAYPLTIVRNFDVVERDWLTVEPTVEAMKVAARAPTPADVAGNTDACGAYGGCQFRDRCPVKQTSFFSSVFAGSSTSTAVPTRGGTSMSILGRMKIIDETAKTPLHSSAGLIGAWYVTSDGPAKYEGIDANGYPKFRKLGGERFAMGKSIELLEACDEPAPAVMPPDVPPLAPVVVAPASAEPDTKRPQLAASVDVLDAPAPDEKPKRKRRTKAEMEAARLAEAAQTATTPEAFAKLVDTPEEVATLNTIVEGTITATSPEETTTMSSTAPAALVLYVNCRPSTPHTDLTKYVYEITERAQREASIEDMRIGDGQHMFGFGKWKGFLAAMVRQAPPSGECVIYGGDIADVVIEALAPLAVKVVR